MLFVIIMLLKKWRDCLHDFLPAGEQSVNKGTRRGTLSTFSRWGLIFWTPLGSFACRKKWQLFNNFLAHGVPNF